LVGNYKSGSITLGALAELAKLSGHEDGPRRAKDALSSWGVHLVCVSHLPKTYLDGAALRSAEGGAPIVALTLRYDRIDNFWFSLLHELAHVGRHFDSAAGAFVDDFSLREAPSRNEDPRENEADEWAEEALIPRDLWASAGLISHASYSAIIAFSQRVGVHPAIVAGRIRHQTRNFRAFAPLLGTGEVRKQLDCQRLRISSASWRTQSQTALAVNALVSSSKDVSRIWKQSSPGSPGGQVCGNRRLIKKSQDLIATSTCRRRCVAERDRITAPMSESCRPPGLSAFRPLPAHKRTS
jgi:hypothetical protein